MIHRRFLFLFPLFIYLQGIGQTTETADSVYVADSASTYIPHKKSFNPAADLVKDSPIVSALDSLAGIKFFQDYYFTSDPDWVKTFEYPTDYIPTFADSVYRQRIDELRKNSPIDYTYNRHVKDYIDLYAVKKRKLTQRLLGLSYLYFPLFEEMLDKYDMPLELKYLAVIESALNPVAGSRVGAKGLWQFMYGTGKVYGLKATSYVDDRFDPYLATDAACRHMKDLYELYEDWFLVLAAYNSGAGNVNKAIRRAGGTKNYWAIWPYLPRETRGYVPAFIAASYVMKYAPEHNLFPLHPGILHNGIDTVFVREPVSFDQISEVLSIPVEDLKFLNPSYKQGIIPVTKGKSYYLRLPREYIGDFINNEYTIYNFVTRKGEDRQKLLQQISRAQEQIIHIVRKGETIGGIARKYNCSVSDIKKWNNLKKNYLKNKQRLTIFPGSSTEPKATAAEPKQDSSSKKPQEKNENPQIHIVKPGETLSLIARKYGVTVQNLKEWNQIKGNQINIKQKLIVGNKSSAPVSSAKSTSAEKFKTYTVKDGDTLWDIAEQFDGITVDDIKKANNLKSNRIKVGQKLKIGKS